MIIFPFLNQERKKKSNQITINHTRTVGNTQQTAGDNISVSNPFDDPVGTSRGAPYPQGTTYPPVSRPQGIQIKKNK